LTAWRRPSATITECRRRRKNLDFKLIKELRAKLRANVALVLHGGSGSGEAAFKKAIAAGIANIHIFNRTARRLYQSLARDDQKNPDEVVPYKLTGPSVEAVQKKAAEFIKLFGAKGKA